MNHAVGSENQILKTNDSCSITESSFQPQYLTILALDITDVCSLYIMTGLIRIFVFNCIMGFHLSLFSSHTVFILLTYFHIICTMRVCVCKRGERDKETDRETKRESYFFESGLFSLYDDLQ